MAERKIDLGDDDGMVVVDFVVNGEKGSVTLDGVEVLALDAQELDGFEVLPPAVAIRNPLAFFARVIEIEHGSDGVDAQSIDVIHLQPEEGAGNEELAHFVAAEIENQRSPIEVLSLAGIGMLVESASIEKREA